MFLPCDGGQMTARYVYRGNSLSPFVSKQQMTYVEIHTDVEHVHLCEQTTCVLDVKLCVTSLLTSSYKQCYVLELIYTKTSQQFLKPVFHQQCCLVPIVLHSFLQNACRIINYL